MTPKKAPTEKAGWSPSGSIDRSLPLPLYYQLKQLLLGDIRARGLGPGDRLPGDHDLCDVFDVSRTVVRQALAELEAEGVIERIKGRGTFVARTKTGEGLIGALSGLHEDVVSRGGTLRSDVLRLEVVPAGESVAAVLRLGPDEPVVVVERLRFVDGEPWVFTTTHVAERLAPGLDGHELGERSLYGLLRDEYGIQLARATRSVEAVSATKVLAGRLGVRPGDPLLLLRSVSYDHLDVPVEMFSAYHRGDRSRFEVSLDQSSRMPQMAIPVRS